MGQMGQRRSLPLIIQRAIYTTSLCLDFPTLHEIPQTSLHGNCTVTQFTASLSEDRPSP
jgi:hypothetical protein